MDDDNWPDWLPVDWTVHAIKLDGRTVKCYVDPKGHNYCSKQEVLDYLKSTNKSIDDEKDQNADDNAARNSFVGPKVRPTKLTPGTSRRKPHSRVIIENEENPSLSRRKSHPKPKVISRSLMDGLPPGWLKEVRSRKRGGKTDPFYLEPLNGLAFFSKNDALCYLETGDFSKCSKKPVKRNVRNDDSVIIENEKNLSTSRKKSHPKVISRSPVDGLPPGWVKEVTLRKRGGKTDLFYLEPLNGRAFFSKKDALCYLETGDFSKCSKKPVERNMRNDDSDLLLEPFRPLTEDDVEMVAVALSNSSRRKVLVTHDSSNIAITGEILRSLRPGAWLNDEVINLYLELLKEREKREPKKFLKCHFFNTFFYKKLISGRTGYDYKSVRRWTTQRKLGYSLLECDKIFVPVHKEIHWCLAVINKKEEKFQYLDSLGGVDIQVMRVLAKYFVDEVKDKNGEDIDVTSWQQEYVTDLSDQENGFDCGVFMIKYADFYSRDIGLCFKQEHMPYFRLRTAKEILRLRAD